MMKLIMGFLLVTALTAPILSHAAGAVRHQPLGREYELGKSTGQVDEYAWRQGDYGLLAGARDEEQTAKDATAKTRVADER